MGLRDRIKSVRDSRRRRKNSWSDKIVGVPVDPGSDKIPVDSTPTAHDHDQPTRARRAFAEKEIVPTSAPCDDKQYWRPRTPAAELHSEPPVQNPPPIDFDIAKVQTVPPINFDVAKVLAFIGVVFLIVWIADSYVNTATVPLSSQEPPSFMHPYPVIAIMGATGAGKSSFIHALGGRDDHGSLPSIGTSLDSCTKNTTWYSASVRKSEVHLLDTPGFDDSAISDSAILQGLAEELSLIHRNGGKLAGLIFLHDVTKRRMGGTSRKQLQLFQKLVGDKSLRNVVLATTHWHAHSADTAKKHEAELISRHWNLMISQGSRVDRHDAGATSATRIVASLISKPGVVPKIVDELERQGKRFDQTEAGKDVDQALGELRAEMKKENDALALQLKKMEKAQKSVSKKAEEERKRLEEGLRHAEEATKKEKERALKATQELREKERKQRENELQQLRNERDSNRRKAEDAEKEKRELRRKLKQVKKTSKSNPALTFAGPFSSSSMSGFARFFAIFCWLLETVFKIVSVIAALQGKGKVKAENAPAMYRTGLLLICWIPFSYLFFTEGQSRFALFVVGGHVLYRLLHISNLIGYEAGESRAKAKAENETRMLREQNWRTWNQTWALQNRVESLEKSRRQMLEYQY